MADIFDDLSADYEPLDGRPAKALALGAQALAILRATTPSDRPEPDTRPEAGPDEGHVRRAG
jgi:hypothetical protein